MNELVPLNTDKELTPDERKLVESYKTSLDLTNSGQIMNYGIGTQSRLSTFADSVLNNVRARDMGEIGKLLSDLNMDLRKFDSATKKEPKILGFFKSLKRKVEYLQIEYTKVEKSIAQIGAELEKQAQILMKDVYLFNQQYDENYKYFQELSLYIVAGEEKIKQMHEEVLPVMKAEAIQSGDQMQIQKYNDMEQQVNRFEKKVHDMKLSRMISIQLAPQIRLVQNNSMTMVEKIQSTIINTLPLWKNQMVIALGLAHAQQALQAQKKVTDATNELLKANSEMLKQSTVEIATQSERGIVDIETIQKANGDIIQAMDDLVRIQTEGREKRLAVEVELKAAEDQLKQRLIESRKI